MATFGSHCCSLLHPSPHVMAYGHTPKCPAENDAPNFQMASNAYILGHWGELFLISRQTTNEFITLVMLSHAETSPCPIIPSLSPHDFIKQRDDDPVFLTELLLHGPDLIRDEQDGNFLWL